MKFILVNTFAANEPDGDTLKPGCIDWSWISNSKCKYISLKFDMRDGAFVILDRDKNRITFEELKKQGYDDVAI